MSFLQYHRTPAKKLGDCIPGDIVTIEGKTGKVAFGIPHYGSDSYWKHGVMHVFIYAETHKGLRCCPHPYEAARTDFTLESFYRSEDG
jgi:hypothetical protein